MTFPVSHTLPAGAVGAKNAELRVGDLVRHYGTKEWARITEIQPRGPSSSELLLVDDKGRPRYWGNYHLDFRLPKETG